MYKNALPYSGTAELAPLLVGLQECLGAGRFGRIGVLFDQRFKLGLGGGSLIELAEADTLLEVRAGRAGRRGVLFDDRIVSQRRIGKLVALKVAFGQIVLGFGSLTVVFVIFQKVSKRALGLIILSCLVRVYTSVKKRQRNILFGRLNLRFGLGAGLAPCAGAGVYDTLRRV